jgi:Ca2+/Na+ antiporter
MLVWTSLTISSASGIDSRYIGLVWIAFGTSIPDAIQAFSKARSMGEKSNVDPTGGLVGSNMFTLTFAMPISWLIYSIVKGGAAVPVAQTTTGTIILAVVIFQAFSILWINVYEWQLTTKVGVGLMVFFILFELFAILLGADVI